VHHLPLDEPGQRHAHQSLPKKSAGKRESPERRALDRLREFNVSSANATLIADQTGTPVDVDLGRVIFYKAAEEFLIEDRSFYVSTPDEISPE
jgi:hypothetical protein